MESCLTFELGDETWHSGPGWYFYDTDYPEEGCVGAFESEQAARDHADTSGAWCGSCETCETSGKVS